jgi:hypothetical protein
LPIDQLTKAVSLLFVSLLNLAKKRPSESHYFRFSFSEGLSLDIEQPVPKNNFNANLSLPIE